MIKVRKQAAFSYKMQQKGKSKKGDTKKYKEEITKPCPNTILSRKGAIISYLIAFERLFRTKQTKKEPACSVVEQSGVPIDRVIGGLRERQGLFYLLTLESIGLVVTENVYLTFFDYLSTLHFCTPY